MGTFALDLSRLVEKAKGQTDLVVRKVMLETFRSVVMRSPVDTGRFRANWVLGYGAPNKTTGEETDKSGGAALGKIAEGVQSARIGDSSLFLTNSLPYSFELENGSSRQAPAGMIRLTLTEVSSKYGA